MSEEEQLLGAGCVEVVLPPLSSCSSLREVWLGSTLPPPFSRLQNDVFDSCTKKTTFKQRLKFQLAGMMSPSWKERKRARGAIPGCFNSGFVQF